MAQVSESYTIDIESIPLGAFVVTPQGTVSQVNETAEDLLAVHAADIIGRKFESIFESAIGKSKGSWQAMKVQTSGAMVCLCRLGIVREGEVWLVNDYIDDPWLDNGIVSLQRHYQRGLMSGDIAHEINNYLAILQGNVELMPLMMRKGDQEKIDSKLELMKRACENITRMCDGFMDMCEDKPRMVPCSVNHVVEHALQFLTPQNMFDDVTVETRLSDDVPTASADPGLLQQAVINLLLNAASAVREVERPVVTVTTAFTPGEPGRIDITVIDNGVGPDDSVTGGILRRRVTTSENQLGVGLLVAKKILADHGGVVSIDRSGGKTTARLEFPVRSASSGIPDHQ